MYTIFFLFILTVRATKHFDCSSPGGAHLSPECHSHRWFPGEFKNFVVFGDSYTDESRLSYFTAHNNTPPPSGKLLPESLDASDGGRVWPRCRVVHESNFADDVANAKKHRCHPVLRRKAL